jgi:hypothetical protein
VIDFSVSGKILRNSYANRKISTLGEITETRKENGMLYYSQLKQQQAQLSVVKEKTPIENFQVNRRYKTICTNVFGMIATGDGKFMQFTTDNVTTY